MIPHLRTFLAYHSGGIVTRVALGAQDVPCISKAQSESHDSHVTLYHDNSHGSLTAQRKMQYFLHATGCISPQLLPQLPRVPELDYVTIMIGMYSRSTLFSGYGDSPS